MVVTHKTYREPAASGIVYSDEIQFEGPITLHEDDFDVCYKMIFPLKLSVLWCELLTFRFAMYQLGGSPAGHDINPCIGGLVDLSELDGFVSSGKQPEMNIRR